MFVAGVSQFLKIYSDKFVSHSGQKKKVQGPVCRIKGELLEERECNIYN